MTRKISSLLILSLLIFAFMAMGAYAAKEPVAKRVINPLVNKSLQYAFPDEHPQSVNTSYRPSEGTQEALGVAGPSVHAIVGNTWYDYQHNGTMGRMIHTKTVSGTTLTHFSWMHLPTGELANRSHYYNFANLSTNSLGVATAVTDPVDDYAGYVGIDVDSQNRGLVDGHIIRNATSAPSPTHIIVTQDVGAGTGFFPFNTEIPQSCAEWTGGSTYNSSNEVIWPKFRYIEYPDGQKMLHVVGMTVGADAGSSQSIYYFRGVTTTTIDNTNWDCPNDPDSSTTSLEVIIDTAYDIAYDIAANEAGKVAICWVANLPCDPADADNESGYDCKQFVQLDNDVYYRISLDRGATWVESPVGETGNQPGPNTNITRWRDKEDQDGWRPYTDMSALITSDGNFHMVWGSRFWPADANSGGQAGLIRGRIFHWSEDNPYVRTVHDMNWDQTTCNGGAWQLNASKMSLSECNGRLYCLFTQFNDIPAGIEDDCATDQSPGYPVGAANGDLYFTVSANGGLNWDAARDITNTRNPGCDPDNGNPCPSEHWASMARYGVNVSGVTITDEIVPSPGWGTADPGWFLDVQYIDDPSPGGIVQSEGTWQQASVRWFRLGCVQEVQEPQFSITPNAITFPAWAKPSSGTYSVNVTVENTGNADLHFSGVGTEVSGSGWLGMSASLAGPTTVSAGLTNTVTGTVDINTNGYSAGTTTHLEGYILFTSDAPSSPDSFPIDFIVTDTLYPPEFDTVSTTCLSLAVSNNGSFGQQGIGKANMDYYPSDCDTTATTYLYDGSPVIGWINGTDTTMYWSIFGTTFVDSVGFVQLSNSENVNDGTHDMYTATFVTGDSTIAFEKTFFAPQDADTCNFIIQCLKVYSYDGQTHSGLVIGEAVDWDIPSDSGSENGSDFDDAKNRIWQYGGEYHQDDTGANAACQDNDARFGGMAFLGMYNKTSDYTALTGPYGAYTASNGDYVYGNSNGFVEGQLYEKMVNSSGYSKYNNANPDSQFVDLHMMMTYVTDYTLNPGETLVIYTNLITVENGTVATFNEYADQDYAWWCGHILPDPPGCGCCQNRGNVDGVIGGAGPVDVSDLTYLVAFLFQGGPPPPCMDEGNVDGVVGGAGPVDVSDLTYLVAFLFQGGPPPPPC